MGGACTNFQHRTSPDNAEFRYNGGVLPSASAIYLLHTIEHSWVECGFALYRCIIPFYNVRSLLFFL